jgi:exopolysaccharide biosynthesis operon protein EpsL
MNAGIRRTSLVVAMATSALPCSKAVFAAAEYRDTLDKAVAAPDSADVERGKQLYYYVGDALTYDSNLFRLPASTTNLATLPGLGPNSSRSDYTNSASAGLSAQWLVGNRQSVDLDLRVDDNRFRRNTNLNNVSSTDRLVWNWGLGSVISGQVGADYSRYLASFVNTAVYTRDVISQSEYFAAARLQLGPRWAIFGGLLEGNNSFSAAQSTLSANNSHSKSVDIGADFATSAEDTIGFDYRYTDSRYPNSIVLNGASFDPDFRDERARVLAKYVVSAKTVIDASAGYLKRAYSSSAIGSFTGDIWRGSLQWQPTTKTQLVVVGWRQLEADLTAQTDYFVSSGESLSPVWTASEKVTLSLLVSRDERSYIGSNSVVSVPQARRDSVTSEGVTMNYTPTRALTVTVSYTHERRNSNQAIFQYNDDKANAGLSFKF